MLVLADSGILLRLLQRTDPEHAVVRQALRILRGRGDTLVVSPQNIAEFWNVCTRPPAARGGLGLTVAETERRLRIIERAFDVLPDSPTAYATWRQLVTDHDVLGVQVHDSRLVAWMQAWGITHVLTLNAGDFARYYPLVTASHPRDLGAPARTP
jgi:predicted nucleic acid-binding protein